MRTAAARTKIAVRQTSAVAPDRRGTLPQVRQPLRSVPMFAVFGRCLRLMVATAHTLLGCAAFRLGSTVGARRHFERALALGGNEFTAYVHLGRIALRDGDYAGYRREMANARAIAPDRFAKLRPSVEGLEPRMDGAPHDETGERATWRSVRQSGTFLRKASTSCCSKPPPNSSPNWSAPCAARTTFRRTRNARAS
jgi:hypothetical protein